MGTLQVNQKVSKTAHIKELNQEIDRLKAELFCTREKNGVYMPSDLFQQREQVRCKLYCPRPSCPACLMHQMHVIIQNTHPAKGTFGTCLQTETKHQQEC